MTLREYLQDRYSDDAVRRARQKLADHKAELARWDAEYAHLDGVFRDLTREMASNMAQGLLEVVVSERDVCYHSREAAAGKAATVQRKVFEVEEYLRRYDVVRRSPVWQV